MRVVTAILLLALAVTVRAEDGYRFRVVDFPAAAATYVFALNNAGQFVGAEQDSAGGLQAIYDDGRQLQRLDLSGAGSAIGVSYAFSINNRGDIAGAYSDAAGVFHGYLHHADGTLTHVEFPGASGTLAYGVNDHATVIGVYFDAQQNAHAFVRRNGHYHNADLPGGATTTPLSINDLEQIAGQYASTAVALGFGYLQSRDGQFTLTSAPGAPPGQTQFISVNNRGQVLGAYADSAGTQHNFLRTGEVYRAFDVPARFAATFVSAQTVNDRDDIVGYYTDAAGLAHGFIATSGERGD